MNSVFTEIEKLTNTSSINVIESISNRYAIFCYNSDGTKTAYYFSVPIRNVKTNNIVDLKFHHNRYSSDFIGSEAKISITDTIKIYNQYGQCDISFQGGLSKKTDKSIFFKNNTHSVEVRPTLNGVMLLFDCDLLSPHPEIKLHFDRTFESICTNDKFFSVMREKFIPFVTASCIGVINSYGKVCAPCEVYNQKINDFDYILTFRPTNKSKNRMAIEINMQEPKLFQDTTVESKHPTINNAFGGISFLGTSKIFGEQWLYSRLEFTNIAQIQNNNIIKSILHIPQLGYNTPPIAVNDIAERFCSFGSNWENKIAILDPIAISTKSNGYYHLDLTKFLKDTQNKSQNFVIMSNTKNKPVIIPTGDSFHSPQILEVNYQ